MDVGFSPLAAQAQKQPTPLAFNFSRRYACDRCRGQKLRCNRDLMALASSPCLRCRKAKAECTIASSSSRREAGPSRGTRRGRVSSVSRDLLNTATALASDLAPAQVAVTSEISRPNLNMSYLAQSACQPSPSLTAAPEVHSPTNIPPRLESISWQDVFATTLYETQEIDFRSVAAVASLPTPVSSSDANASVNQPTVTPANRLSSSPVSDIVKSNLPSNVWAELDAVMRADRDSTPGAVRPWSSATVTPHLTENESNPPGFTHERTSVLLEGHDTPSDCWPEQDTIERSGIALAVFQDKNIDLLSDLSAILMKDLHRITTYESASSFLLTHSDSTAAEYFFKTMDSTTSFDYIIGKMLHGTERFLEAVQSLNQPSLNHSCPESEHSADAEIDNLGESEGITDSSETSLEARMEERWRFIQAVLNRATYVAGDDSTGTLPGGNKNYTPQPKRDAPSTFALLTCYICLIKIYESVFSIIHLSFEVSRKWTLFPKLPQTIPSLRINDFVLQNHHDLQIKILIQVSTYMLDSVENALGEMLSNPLFQALLKSSLRQGGYDSSSDNETGTKIVRDMMKKIEDFSLNGNR